MSFFSHLGNMHLRSSVRSYFCFPTSNKRLKKRSDVAITRYLPALSKQNLKATIPQTFLENVRGMNNVALASLGSLAHRAAPTAAPPSPASAPTATSLASSSLTLSPISLQPTAVVPSRSMSAVA